MARLFPIAAALIVASLAPAAQAIPGRTQDVFYGTGSFGPFTLAWKQIAPGTETVQVGEMPQTRGVDYTLDADVGTLTFTHPIPSGTAALVRYEYDPGHAQPNRSAVTLPLSVALAENAQGSLAFNALLHGPTDPTAGTGTLALGLGGSWSGLSKTTLSLKTFYNPAMDAADQKTAPGGWNRTGLVLSAATDAVSKTHLTVGMARVGEGLGSLASDNGMTAGTQLFTVGTQTEFSSRLSASANFAQSRPTDGSKSTPTQTQSLAVDAKPDKRADVKAEFAQSLQPGNDTSSIKTTATLAPNSITQIKAQYAETTQPGKDANSLQTIATITPNAQLAVSAGVGQDTTAGTTTHRQSVGVQLTPRLMFALNVAVGLHQTDQFSASSTTVGAKLKPVSYLEVSGSQTLRTASSQDKTQTDLRDSSTAQVTFSPFKTIRLAGTYAQNPDDANNDAPARLARKGVSLGATLGPIDLKGGYDWTQQEDAATLGTTVSVGLGLRFSSALKLTGDYKQSLTGARASQTGANVYTVGLTHTLGDRFNLTVGGAVTHPVGAGPAPQTYTATPTWA